MRTIIFVVGVLIAIVAIGFIGTRKYTKSSSPEAKAYYSRDSLKIDVSYCQPYKKNRNIFGSVAALSLVPYGEVWRTGANEATEIEINQDLQFSGALLKRGRYTLFTIPGKDNWIIIFNSDLGQWGAFDYDKSKDVLRIQASPKITTEIHEQFTISFTENSEGLGMNFDWDYLTTRVPIKLP